MTLLLGTLALRHYTSNSVLQAWSPIVELDVHMHISVRLMFYYFSSHFWQAILASTEQVTVISIIKAIVQELSIACMLHNDVM